MTEELNLRSVQLDDVVDSDYYIDLMLEGHLPPQDETATIPEDPT